MTTTTIAPSRARAALVHLLVFSAGAAALSWELLWQIKASLAIGISAMGTAITLVATMGGMTAGALGMGRILEARTVAQPLRIYGLLEVVVGLSGAGLLGPGCEALAHLDGSTYARHPTLAPLLHVVGIVLLLGPPTFAMGATVPLFGLLARRTGASIATLYGLNTAGAAMGVLVLTFAVLPRLGVEVSGIALASINLLIAACAWLVRLPEAETTDVPASRDDQSVVITARAQIASVVVFVTGFVSFGLEVAWFRSLRAAFLSTTASFAIVLASILIALAMGARLAPIWRRRRASLGLVLAAGGALVLLVTPLLERFDKIYAGVIGKSFWTLNAMWLAGSLVVMGGPMVLLGSCLPWMLGEHAETRAWSRLYAVNTFGAVAGSLAAAWLLLPAIGSEITAWLLGAVASVVGLAILDPPGSSSLRSADARRFARRGSLRSPRLRKVAAGVTAVAAAVAILAESGVGRTRVQGNFGNALTKMIAFEQGPDSALAVADDSGGDRVLVIDGFAATSQGITTHYMEWMGRLPMMIHPDPKQALVICFGTGQTANAVRQEGPQNLDIVELNAGVLRMAVHFTSNQGVLQDPRVNAVVMDGRAWLRRTDHVYDVVTLEPMPPNFAGVNALYSLEFYRLIERRLRIGGVVAQWLPFHILSVDDAVAIVATFREVFGDALLWVDPVDFTGIIVGRRGSPSADLLRAWPGFARDGGPRSMKESAIPTRIALDPFGLERYSSGGAIITDDNQLLAFGAQRRRDPASMTQMLADNLARVRASRL